jgi:hypothetical protein
MYIRCMYKVHNPSTQQTCLVIYTCHLLVQGPHTTWKFLRSNAHKLYRYKACACVHAYVTTNSLAAASRTSIHGHKNSSSSQEMRTRHEIQMGSYRYYQHDYVLPLQRIKHGLVHANSLVLKPFCGVETLPSFRRLVLECPCMQELR